MHGQPGRCRSRGRLAGEDLTGLGANAGTATIIDLPAASTLSLTQGDANVPGPGEADDQFGLRVAAAGHFLVVAAPYEDIGAFKNAGNAFQADMTCTGTVPTVGAHGGFSLDTVGVVGSAEKGDRFGLELAFDGTTGAGDPSLVVGAPLKSDGSVLDAGRVTVLPSKSGGIYVGTGSVAFGQSDGAIAGIAKRGDQFGGVIGSSAS